MKKDTHPKYHYITATCSCGQKVEVGTVLEEDAIELDICSRCHPFYTGKQKLVDTSGRVERFRKRFGQSATDTAS
ncbi:MAG: 50S ribosomal protein L31 [Proteobacteria bacterium]|nr:50S ribosomal protein L31 [Pseudomonadota bacterium]